tara:strand:- start:889 stop:1350 length:462 start_codon:yes stop_codon:yes gene_type:complete
MDEIDKKILKIIQKNATIPLSELSKRVGISSTPCWNRVKKMEENGVITSRITLLDYKKINLPLIIILDVSVKSHKEDWIAQFTNAVMKYDEIIEVHRIANANVDYILKVVAPSIEEYDKFQQKLIKEFEFTKMSSSICLKTIKQNYQLPLHHL